MPQKIGYDSPVSKEAGFGSPLELAAQSRYRKESGFLHGTSYGGADGKAQALPVFAPRVPRPSNPSALPPNLEVGARQFRNGTPEVSMTKSLPALAIGDISVRQLDGLYSLNDLHKASGGNPSQRPGEFMRLEQTQALTAAIETAGIPAVKTKEGRNGGTYAAREVVIAYAAWVNATFHLKVIRVFLDTVQPARQHNPAIDYDRISPAQAQDLKELVHSIVDAKVQGFGETWNRLHRKFRVNSYLELPATKFDEARDYLLGKLPPEAAAAQPDPVAVPTLMGRRWLIATTPDRQETVLPIAHSAMVVSAEDLPARIEQGDFFASDLLLARIASAVAMKQGQRAMFRERQLLSA